MRNKEKYNINDKNSQEILLYLQRKNIKKKPLYSEEFSSKKENKLFLNKKNENLPPTRMMQFINNKSFYSPNNNQKIIQKSISEETKELTTTIITPSFKQIRSPSKLNGKQNNSKLSPKTENDIDNVNNKSINYLDFHLHENLERYMKDKENICHLYLPKKYKDDEKYKSNLYKYLKIENKKNVLRDRGNKTKIFEPKINFSKMDKIKKTISVKKRKVNKISFFNKNEELYFNLFKDDIIGIDKEWQLPIIYHNYDNDIDSDEDQISKGKAKMMYDLRISIIKWSQNKNVCHNYKYLNTPINNVEYIKKSCLSV